MKKQRVKLFQMTSEDTVAACSYLEASRFYRNETGLYRDEIEGPECEYKKSGLRRVTIFVRVEELPPKIIKRHDPKFRKDFQGYEVLEFSLLKAMKFDRRVKEYHKDGPFMFCTSEW